MSAMPPDPLLPAPLSAQELAEIEDVLRHRARPSYGRANRAFSDITLLNLLATVRALQQQLEVLTKALEIMREATFQSHTSHWDATGGSGSGCPACIEIRRLRGEADAITVAALREPPHVA